MALPAELLGRVAALLTWRETLNMALVSVGWRSAVLAASRGHFELRTTEISAENDLMTAEIDRMAGIGAFSMEKHAVERLGSNFGGWADATFAPSLVVIAARTNRPRVFVRGALWHRAMAAIETKKLLPPGCLVIGTLSVTRDGREGDEDDEDDEDEEEESSLVVTVALLPETQVAVDRFERKELRQIAKGYELESPLANSVTSNDGFLVLSVNPRSGEELTEEVGSWGRGVGLSPAVVGGVFPHADCSNPLMLYWTREQSEEIEATRQTAVVASKKPKEKSKPTRGRNQRKIIYPRGQRHGPSTRAKNEEPKIKMEYPSNIVVRFRSKRVRLRPWASSGVAPVSGIVRCCSSRSSTYTMIYDQMELANAADSRHVWSMRELLGGKLDLTADQAIWIATSESRDELQRFLTSPSCLSTSEVQVISCSFSAANNVVYSLDAHRWEIGAYGIILARADDTLRLQRAQIALNSLLDVCKATDETPFGLLQTMPRSLSALELEVQTISLATNLAIGPTASIGLSATKVQQYSCSGFLLCHARKKIAS